MNDYQSDTRKQKDDTLSVRDKSLIVDIGRDAAGNTVAKDISKFSNILISGTTGSGKTSFVTSLLLSLMTNYSPDRIRFVIFDSKGIEYNYMNSSEYLFTPIIYDPYDSGKFERAAAIMVEEAKRRIEIGVPEDIPDILFIADDYADAYSNNNMNLMMQKLLKLSRVARIHVMIITSTPLASIIPMEIKELIPYRIAFSTTSSQTSHMIIGQSGAEMLSYPGEFILKCGQDLQTYTTIVFDDPHKEMKRVGDRYISKNDEITVTVEENTYEDDLTEEAIAFILESRQVSISKLQRRFRIGYSRAASIIDEIEEKGIIGPADGSEPRQIYLTEEEYFNK